LPGGGQSAGFAYRHGSLDNCAWRALIFSPAVGHFVLAFGVVPVVMRFLSAAFGAECGWFCDRAFGGIPDSVGQVPSEET
jgi:hypothetical protein